MVGTRTEPLFIRFANFQFTGSTLEEFFNVLMGDEIEIPLEEIFLYYRTEDSEYFGGPPHLTETEKERISNDLESVRSWFTALLLALTQQENYDSCLESINSLCSEIPISFRRHHKDPGRLELANPSVEKVEQIGWGDFVSRIIALDLGKYLLSQPATKIRLCKWRDCQKFFAERSLKADFCSDHCRQLFHRADLSRKHYYRDRMREYRSQGRHKW